MTIFREKADQHWFVFVWILYPGNNNIDNDSLMEMIMTMIMIMIMIMIITITFVYRG